jgi:hypothetical protein
VVLLVQDELSPEHAIELERYDIELMVPPLNVNALVRQFWPAAA